MQALCVATTQPKAVLSTFARVSFWLAPTWHVCFDKPSVAWCVCRSVLVCLLVPQGALERVRVPACQTLLAPTILTQTESAIATLCFSTCLCTPLLFAVFCMVVFFAQGRTGLCNQAWLCAALAHSPSRVPSGYLGLSDTGDLLATVAIVYNWLCVDGLCLLTDAKHVFVCAWLWSKEA